MDSRLTSLLEKCFFSDIDGEKACRILEERLDEIDFDDEDDVEDIFEILLRALTCTKGMDVLYKEDGSLYADEGVKFLERLISNGFDINFNLSGRNSLIIKLAEKDVLPEIFQKVVDLGADVYVSNHSNENVLTLSAEHIVYDWGKPDYEASERLPIYIVEKFGLSDFDCADSRGKTPLMYAVLTNKQNLINVLLKNGADVNATGGDGGLIAKMYGVSPFALACRQGNYEIAKKLLEAGADETLCDAEGTPAMFSLIFKPLPTEVELFEERKTDILELIENIDYVDSNGDTLLIKACTKDEYNRSGKDIYPDKNVGLIYKLLERGANVNAINNRGETALHQAASCSELDIVKALVNADIKLDVQDCEGDTAITKACFEYCETCVRYLIRKGADINIKNNEGKTVMDIAVERSYQDVIDLCLTVADNKLTQKKPAQNPVKPVKAEHKEEKQSVDENEDGDKTELEKTFENPPVRKKVIEPPAHVSLMGSIAIAPPFALACRSGNCDYASNYSNSISAQTACDADGIPAFFYLLFEPLGFESESANFQNTVYQGKEKIVYMLANVEYKDAEGDTLFLKAFQKRSYSNGREIVPYRNGNVISSLIMRGVDANAVNNKGRRPIHYVAENAPYFFDMLITLGADVNAQDCEGDTALILACKNKFENEAVVLLKNGADYNIKNNAGESAKDIAEKLKLKKVLALTV